MFRTVAFFALAMVPVSAASIAVQEASAPAIISTLMPGFYNGYLWSAEPQHVLTLFAPDGHELFSLPMRGQGTGNVRIESVAVDSDQTLAVGWQGPPRMGIDILDLSGTFVRRIDTGRFVPAHLSFGPDHCLWVLGWQRDETGKSYDRADYPILRKYSMDGAQTGAYLLKSLFAEGLPPGTSEWQERRITVTADRVGVEVVSGNIGNQREWVELDLKGNLTGRWKLDAWDKFPGVVFTSDDQAYVQRYNRETKSSRVLRLNHATSTWEVVNTPSEELYGADGNKLVYAKWPDGVMHLSWLPQP